MSLLPFVTECGPTTLSPLLRRALSAEKLAEDNGKLAHDLSIELDAHSKALERASRAIDELMTERDALAATVSKCRTISVSLQNIHWGNDGDCGVSAIAQDLEELTCMALDHLNSDTPQP